MCPDEPADTPAPEILACSFCGKGVDAVGKLITAPAACICDECIDLCNDLIEGDFDHRGDGALRSGFGSPPCDLCRLPKSAAELVPISFGAQLCRTCLDAVREVIERERTESRGAPGERS